MNNKKPIIFIALLFIVCLTIGGTIAYYTSSDTFNNEFNAGTYDIETQENFVSPDNWTPGTTTPKTVIATNKGTTPAAVRIKLTPSWVDKDGNPLSLTDGNDNDAAIINFTQNYDRKWVYQDGYYYYKRALNENQSTTSLLKSVTFNPNFEIDKTQDCETVNGLTTCRTTYSDYSGGTYTLQVEIETCQYDKYQEIWNTNISLNDPILVDGTLMVHNNDYTETFGKSIDRDSFESVTTIDNKNVPEGAIDSWDVSAEQNGSVMAWYIDADNDSKYELYIGQEDGVKANSDSSYAFSSFENAERIDMSNLDTSSVTNMSYMFYNVGRSASTFNLDIRGWDTSSVTNMTLLFYYAGYNTTTFNIGDISGWDTSSVTNMSNMFAHSGQYATTWNIGDISGWDTSSVTNMDYMFISAGQNATTWNSIGTLKVYATSIQSIFSHCKNAKATLNIYNNPTYYGSAFDSAVTVSGSGITVNYSSTTTNINNIIATKSSNSNVVKGSQLD